MKSAYLFTNGILGLITQRKQEKIYNLFCIFSFHFVVTFYNPSLKGVDRQINEEVKKKKQSPNIETHFILTCHHKFDSP